MASARLPIGPIYFDDVDALLTQISREPGAVRARTLDSYAIKIPEVSKPSDERCVSFRRGRKRLVAKLAPCGIEGRDRMGVLVRVDPANDDRASDCGIH